MWRYTRFSWFSSLLSCLIKLDCNLISGGRTVRRVFEFGRTYVVRPKGKHQATVVWLHGLGDNGSRCYFVPIAYFTVLFRGLHNNRETEEVFHLSDYFLFLSSCFKEE